jgi:hypothetical protein
MFLNVADTQHQEVLANPNNYLVIVPHHGGAKLFSDTIGFTSTLKSFIETIDVRLRIEDPRAIKDIMVIPPIPLRTPSKKSIYTSLNIAFIRNTSPNLRDFMLYQQTFAVNPSLVFSVVPIIPDFRSWVVMTIQSTSIRQDEDVILTHLVEIKAHLATDPGFQEIVDHIYQKKDEGGSTNERILDAMSTFDITYFPLHDDQGRLDPVYVLSAKPIATDDEDHEKWIQAIRWPKKPYVTKQLNNMNNTANKYPDTAS